MEECDKLYCTEDGTLKMNVLDEEGDLILCTFNYDGCVHMDLEELSYVALSTELLLTLADAVEEAEQIYKNRNNEF